MANGPEKRTGQKLLALTAACVALASVVKGAAEQDTESTGTPPSNERIDNTEQHGEGCEEAFAADHPAAETSPEKAREIGKILVTCRFGTDEWPAAEELWHNESGWNPRAENPDSDACGIPQSWPCNKMTGGDKTHADMSVEEQLEWGINYVEKRYGTPTAALEWWYDAVPVNGQDVGNWY
jgi:hypothetical protein